MRVFGRVNARTAMGQKPLLGVIAAFRYAGRTGLRRRRELLIHLRFAAASPSRIASFSCQGHDRRVMFAQANPRILVVQSSVLLAMSPIASRTIGDGK